MGTLSNAALRALAALIAYSRCSHCASAQLSGRARAFFACATRVVRRSGDFGRAVALLRCVPGLLSLRARVILATRSRCFRRVLALL